MKKLLFATGITLLGLGAALAQTVKQQNTAQPQAQTTDNNGAAARKGRASNPETIAQRKTERLAEQLDLDAGQKEAVKAILLKDAQAHTGRAMPSQEVDAQLKKVFSATQNTRYEQLKAARNQRMQERSAERGAPKAAPAVKGSK